MPGLLQSRRFWLAVLDVIIAVTGYVTAHFIPDPNTVDLVKFLIVTLQPVILLVICAYTVENVQAANLAAKTSLPQPGAKAANADKQ